MRENERRFGFLLYDAARLMRRDFERRARNLGLTRAQWSVLAHLSRNEGISQAALAEILDLQPITVARTLERLEKMGWIERRRDSTDRRVRRLFLAPRSQPMLVQLFALGKQTRNRALSGFSAAERERLLLFLDRVKGNLSAPRRENAEPEGRRRRNHV